MTAQPSTYASQDPSPQRLGEPGCDLDLHDADFERVRLLIHQHAGISLNTSKRAMVHSRLARRLRETGYHSFTAYLSWLESGDDGSRTAEWQEFINCLTTNLTAFFRERHHFEMLACDLRARAGRTTRIWCNAASTGEEAYSIAMTAELALGARPPVRILATDIDTQVLKTASRGVYRADSPGLNLAQTKRYFMRGKANNDGYIRVKPELSSLVSFAEFNLTDAPWSLKGPFDIVFCRNVMIYFDAATQRRVLEQTHRVMQPGGLLYVGHSENFSNARDLFRLRGKTIYERV